MVLGEGSSSRSSRDATLGPRGGLGPSWVGADVPCASWLSPELSATTFPSAERGNALGAVSV